MDHFRVAEDDCFPKIKVRSANSAPWIDLEVLKAVRKKKRLIKRNLKSPPLYTTGQYCDGVGRNASSSSNGDVNSALNDCHLL